MSHRYEKAKSNKSGILSEKHNSAMVIGFLV